MNRPKRAGIKTLASLAIVGMLAGAFVPTAQAAGTSSDVPAITDLGALVSGKANMHNSAFGVENGQPVAYLLSNVAAGEQGNVVLSVIDHINGKLMRTRVLPSVVSVERIHVAGDGNVYFSANKGGSNNALWQYSPKTTQVRELATYGHYGRQISSDHNSVVYVGVHGGTSKAQLATWDPRSEKFEFMALTDAPTARATAVAGDYVYASVDNGADRYLVKRSITTGEVTRIATTTNAVNTMAVAGNWLVVLDGFAELRFLNLDTEQWATKDGAEQKLSSITFGESPQRDGKILVTSGNTFHVIDGSDPATLTITNTGLRLAASAIRGTQWAGDTGTNEFYTVQNTGHISHFDLGSKKETLTQPLQQNQSHPLTALGRTASGNLYASSAISGTGVIYTPTTGAKSERAGLGKFTDSTVYSGSEYLVTTAGTVARVAVESAGSPEVIFTPDSGAEVVGLVPSTQGLLILVNTGQGSELHSYSPAAGETYKLNAGLESTTLTSGVRVGSTTYLSGTVGTQSVIIPMATNGLVGEPVAIKPPNGHSGEISALSTPDSESLWGALGDSIVQIDPSSGEIATIVDYSDVLGTSTVGDTKDAVWYGDNLFVADEGGIVDYDATTKTLNVAVQTSEAASSWQLVAGETEAGLYFLSQSNPSNLRAVEVEFDPNAGGSDGSEVGPIETEMPGVDYGDEISLGVPVPVASIIDVAFGELDGRKVGYTATSSDGSLFNVIDVEANRTIATSYMHSVIQVWKIEIAPNGNVYISAIGKTEQGQQRGELWIYNPTTEEMKFAGEVPGASSTWSMVIDQDNNAYIGTYKTGEVVKYNALDGSFARWSQVAGQEYVRSIEYHDGYVYAGTGTVGNVVKINAEDPTQREVISTPLLEKFGVSELPWAYDMQKVNNWLLVNFTGTLNSTAFYNLDTGTWSDAILTPNAVPGTPTQAGVPGYTQLAPRNGKVYLGYNGTAVEVDLNGDVPTFSSTGVSFATGIRGQVWADLTELGRPGEWLVTGTRQGPMRALNFATKESILLPSQVETQNGTPLHSMALNADGGIYFVTYPAANGAEYNTNTGQYQRFLAEQAESMITVGDATYFGIYPGAYIEKVTKDPNGKPVFERLFELGNDQDRPYHMVESDGKLFIGSIPGYEKHNGALSIYDLKTGELTVETGIVENQSVVGLAVKDDMVWGSTTIVGGLGADPIATEAKLFKYNASTGEKVGEYSLNLPRGQKAKHISALSFGPDGNLWGTTDGYVFVMDPNTMELIENKTVNIYPEITRYGMWRPMSFEWHKGLLYMNVASRLTVINPETMEYRQISDKAEELSRFIIAPLAPEIAEQANEQYEPSVANEYSATHGLYFFGSAKADQLRVYPLFEAHKEPALSTSTELTASESRVGTATNLVASVTTDVASDHIPQGQVAFLVDSQVVGTSAVENGTASISVHLSGGAHTVEARFVSSNQALFAGSQSAPLSLTTATVSSELTAKVIRGKGKNNHPISVDVTVSSTVVPTGTVVLLDGNEIVAQAQLVQSTPGSGVASISLSHVKAGKHKLVAKYLGDGSVESSTKKLPTIHVGK